MEILTLGQLIEKIKPIAEQYPQIDIYFDFCNLIPTELNCHRRHWGNLAIGFSCDTSEKASIEKFLTLLQDAIGKTFQGYKGGDFEMDENTPIWADNYGKWTDTKIVDVCCSKLFECVYLITEKEIED